MRISNVATMKFFRKEKLITETICKECGMEFSEPERMLRHMIKAHSQSKGPSCNCQFFQISNSQIHTKLIYDGMVGSKPSTSRSINYLRSDNLEKMSDEVPQWWDGLAEELQIDIEIVHEKATSQSAIDKLDIHGITGIRKLIAFCQMIYSTTKNF